MNILIIGEPSHLHESSLKFGEHHSYTMVENHRDAEKYLESYDLVLDFIIEEDPAQFEIYRNKNVTAFLNTSKISLGELAFSRGDHMTSKIFGFNGMPTFLNRSIFEVSVWKPEHVAALSDTCALLQTKFLVVDDRVGLVTPRVICMIINEAYYTHQEGTASREDIDLAMKLGTNYPYGPFEWCRLIGIRHVYELLEAVYDDTRDERYKICPLLKKEYLRHV